MHQHAALLRSRSEAPRLTAERRSPLSTRLLLQGNFSNRVSSCGKCRFSAHSGVCMYRRQPPIFIVLEAHQSAVSLVPNCFVDIDVLCPCALSTQCVLLQSRYL